MSDHIRRMNRTDSASRSKPARIRCRCFIVCWCAVWMSGCGITSPFTCRETPCVPLFTESPEVVKTLGERQKPRHHQESVAIPERVVALGQGPFVNNIHAPKRVDAGATRIPERLLLVEAQLEQLSRRLGSTDERIEARAHKHNQYRQDWAEQFAANDATVRESHAALEIHLNQLNDSLQYQEKDRADDQLANDRLFDEVISGLEQIMQSREPAAAFSAVSQLVPLEPDHARVTESGSSTLPGSHQPP